MSVGRSEPENFWGYEMLFVTTKLPSSVISRAPHSISPCWKLYMLMGEENNYFLEIISQRTSDDLELKMQVFK